MGSVLGPHTCSCTICPGTWGTGEGDRSLVGMKAWTILPWHALPKSGEGRFQNGEKSTGNRGDIETAGWLTHKIWLKELSPRPQTLDFWRWMWPREQGTPCVGKGLLLLATPWSMLPGPSFPSPSPLLLQHCWWEVVECRCLDLGRLDANLSSAS